MKTEAKFAIKIKELMQTTPLDQISVKNLCDTVGVNRQTFYYHFRDIYDLLTAIFLNEKIEGLSKANTWSDVFHICLIYAKDNFNFLKAIYDSSASDLAKEFISNSVYQALHKTVAESEKYAILSKEDIRGILGIVSATTSRLIESVIISGKFNDLPINEKKIKAVYGNILQTILQNAIDAKKRGYDN